MARNMDWYSVQYGIHSQLHGIPIIALVAIAPRTRAHTDEVATTFIIHDMIATPKASRPCQTPQFRG